MNLSLFTKGLLVAVVALASWQAGGAAPLRAEPYTAPSTPTYLSLVVSPAAISCNGQAVVTARLLLPDGSGAPRQLVQFTSSLGTVVTNIMTDDAGYVTTTYTAPYNASSVQITALFGPLSRTQTIYVTCGTLSAPAPPVLQPLLPITPPKTGDAGLVAGSERVSAYWYLAGAIITASCLAAGGVAVARQRI